MGFKRRARKTITLKFEGKCRDCGAILPVGSRARWYGRGRVYGLDCHEDTRRYDPDTGVQVGRTERVALAPADDCALHDEEGAHLERRLSDEPIPQTKLFD